MKQVRRNRHRRLPGSIAADVEDIKDDLKEMVELMADIRHQLQRIADAAEED